MEPNIQGQPMNPMGSNVPTKSVTQIDVTEASVPVAPAPEKKSGKGMLLGLIFCLILAAGGIGFGVWAMMDGNTQKTNYEKQISNLNSQISALQEQAAKGDDTDDVDPVDYIYVGEWGLKIKISEKLNKKISYVFGGEQLQITDDSNYDINKKLDDNYNWFSIMRKEKGGFNDCTASCPTYVSTVNEYDYAIYVVSNATDGLLENSDEFSAFFDPENYSEI